MGRISLDHPSKDSPLYNITCCGFNVNNKMNLFVLFLAAKGNRKRRGIETTAARMNDPDSYSPSLSR